MPVSKHLPHIYASFARGDEALVLPIISALEQSGFRICRANGAEDDALLSAGCVISFISGKYVESTECRRELLTAQRNRLEVIDVYVETVYPTPGMQLILCLNQALHFEKKKPGEITRELTSLESLAKYRSDTASKASAPSPKKSTQAIIRKAKRRTRRPTPKFNYSGISYKAFRWPLLAYGIIAPIAMHLSSLAYEDIFRFMLANLLPLTIISAVLSLIMLALSVEYTSDDLLEFTVGGAMISLIVSPFFVHCADLIIFKILIPLPLAFCNVIFSYVIFEAASIKNLIIKGSVTNV